LKSANAFGVNTLVEFRIAKNEDASQIGALHAASWATAYRGMLSDAYLDGDLLSERTELWVERLQTLKANQRVVLAEVEGQLAGFACAFGSEDPDLGTLLDNLHISREFQRQGIGKELMSEIASWSLAEYPGEGLHLWVLEANWPARNFYHQLEGTIVSEDVWLAPDGRSIPSLCYAWKRPELLLLRSGLKE
jgi:ribosomal protein S18 acetylase RimI-like enzyme